MKKLVLIAAICVSLTACMSSGIKVDNNKMSEFKAGKTTYSDVIASLGNPSQTTVSASGIKTISYVYMSVQSRPENFIPYVGAFVGGVDSEHSVVTMSFDKSGILKDYNATNGAAGSGYGLAGISQERNTSQPRKIE